MTYEKYKEVEEKVKEAVGNDKQLKEFIDATTISGKLTEIMKERNISEEMKQDILGTEELSRKEYPENFDWDRFGQELYYNQYSDSNKEATFDEQLKNMGFKTVTYDELIKRDLLPNDFQNKGMVTVEVITDEVKEQYGVDPDLFSCQYLHERELAPIDDDYINIKKGDLLRLVFEEEDRTWDTYVQTKTYMWADGRDEVHEAMGDQMDIESMRINVNAKHKDDPFIIKDAAVKTWETDKEKPAYEVKFIRYPQFITKEYTQQKLQDFAAQHGAAYIQSNDKDTYYILKDEKSNGQMRPDGPLSKEMVETIMSKTWEEVKNMSYLLVPDVPGMTMESDKYREFDDMVNEAKRDMRSTDHREARYHEPDQAER